MGNQVQLLDHNGAPIVREQRQEPQASQRVAAEAALMRFMQRASYDAARTSNETANHWANADAYDADSAHNKAVRHTLIHRSRYELANNPYAAGIAQTYSTDLVSTGPNLRMQTSSEGFNQLVELQWFNWCKATGFARKLWCMSHAKYGDGESFGIAFINPSVRHQVQLDLVLYEAEQVQTPFPPFNDPNYIDGIKFDKFRNPVWYDVLKSHPGSNNSFNLTLEAERIPANRVLHWFTMMRPGQHRGVCEWASALNTGAAARRWHEATLAAAETAADLNVIFHTNLPPDSAADPVQPFSTIDLAKRMGMMAPMGWDATHFKSEHPNATFDSYNKALINAMARAANMPLNKAMCYSGDYNYASGRLDHQTYYAALDVVREECNALVLDKLFELWFDIAVRRFGWLGGSPSLVGKGARAHLWDWPKHRVADVEAEANANETKLKSGQLPLHRLYTDGGMDLDDELPEMAKTYGVTPEEFRRRLFDTHFPPPKAAAPAGAPQEPTMAAILSRLLNAPPKVNGNGVHYAN